MTIDTLTPIQTVGEQGRRWETITYRGGGNARRRFDVTSKENEQPCNAAKQQKRVNIAAALKERLANLTKQKEEKEKEKEKMMEIVAVEEEEEEEEEKHRGLRSDGSTAW